MTSLFNCLFILATVFSNVQGAAETTKAVVVMNPDADLPDQFQTCWNVELSDPTLFCTGMVTWPITLDLYMNPQD